MKKKAFNPMNNSSLNSEKLCGLGWSGLFDAKLGLEHTVKIIKEAKYNGKNYIRDGVLKNAIKYCCAIMILVIVSLNTTNVDAKTYNVNYTKTISSYEGKSIQLKWKENHQK